MASRISKFDNVGYEPVSDEEEPSLSRPSPEALHQSSWALCTSIRYILYAITACFLVLGGVFIGSHRYIPTQDDTSLRICKWSVCQNVYLHCADFSYEKLSMSISKPAQANSMPRSSPMGNTVVLRARSVTMLGDTLLTPVIVSSSSTSPSAKRS